MTFASGAAQAAITADQLWAAWQDAGAQSGLSVKANSATREGTALRLSGVTISAGSAENFAPTEAMIEEIPMTESADGSISILPSPRLTMSMGDEANGGLTLNIPEVMVSAAGAVLAGSGFFTFDNATGQPLAAGEANVTLTGGNKLIDGLIALGVLSEEDAGRARMMMAMSMNSAGDDVLKSKIEARADGSILVNGQRVQ